MQTTNFVPATVEQPPPVRGRRGQTMVEFALTLPLLLLLLLGIIEFGRIFQAWVTLQNAARTAARYAVTGRYDQTIFQNTDAYDADVKNNTGFDANGVPIVQSAPTIMEWNPADGYASYSVSNGRAVGAPSDGVRCDANDPTRGLTNPDVPTALRGGTTTADLWQRLKPASGNYMDWFFASHWNGIDCDPDLPEHLWLRQDIMRLVSINLEARIGAAGLALRQGGVASGVNPDSVRVPGFSIPGTGINTEDGANNDANVDNSLKIGWFHAYICSSRQAFDREPVTNKPHTTDGTASRYYWSPVEPTASVYPDQTERDAAQAMWDHRFNENLAAENIRSCQINEYHNIGTDDMNAIDSTRRVNQYDAGGPGDYVEIVLYFNHPTITPVLGLARGQRQESGSAPGYLQLQARRTMINEAFRASRVFIPPVQGSNQQGGGSNQSPSATPFIPTATYTLTATASATSTGTPVPPDCALISITETGTIDSAENNKFRISFINNNAQTGILTAVSLRWTLSPASPNMYPNQMILGPNPNDPPHWNLATSGLPATTGGALSVNSVSPGWSNAGNRTDVPGMATSIWRVEMANMVGTLADNLSVFDFAGTDLTIQFQDYGITCHIVLQPQQTVTPRPTSTRTATLNCPGNFAYSFENFLDDAVVQFRFTNNSTQAVDISAFSLVWYRYIDDGLELVRASAGGTYAGDPAGTELWTDPAGEGPATGPYPVQYNSAHSAVTRRSVPASSFAYLYFDFSGTTLSFPGAYGLDTQPADFNGSTLQLNGSASCVIQMRLEPTRLPQATRTFTPSNTPTNTFTATFTPTFTFTPTSTFTATATRTPTNTATATFTASNTATASNTPTRTFTATSSFTPSRTNTPTFTFTPSRTFTPSITPTPSNTPPNTPTRTSTSTRTSTNTRTTTPTRTLSLTPSQTLTPSRTFTPSQTATATRTFTPSATYTRSNTPLPTNTATRTNTPLPPTVTQTRSNTPVPTATQTRSITPTRTLSPTPSATFTPSRTLTSTATASRTNTPSPQPSATPTRTSTNPPPPTDDTGGCGDACGP